MSEAGLMTAKELAARLGYGHQQFNVRRKRGEWRKFLAPHATGYRKYLRAAVDRYLIECESPARLAERKRIA